MPSIKVLQKKPENTTKYHGVTFVSFTKKIFNMPDNLKKTKPQDASFINVHEAHEMDYWTQALGVPKDKLIATVVKVGTTVAAVKKALKR